MMYPSIHSWKYAQPTGIGFDYDSYAETFDPYDTGYRGLAGLSSMGDVQQIEGLASVGASTTVSMLVGLSVIAPVVGTAIAGIISVGMALAQMFKGCGQTCIAASNIANQAEPILLQNLNTYLAAPVHYASMQAAALNNFDFTWKALMQACGNPQLAQAGQNCIADRQQGACKWKATPAGWVNAAGVWTYVPAGPAGSGSTCWNWFSGYRDGIANDPTVQPDPPAPTAGPGQQVIANSDGSYSVVNIGTGSSSGGSLMNASGIPVSSTLSSLPMPLLLGAAALLVIMTVGD